MTTWRRAVCVVWAAFAMALSGFGPAVAQVPTLDAANQLLDYGQRQFAQYFPGSPATQRLDPWIYRYYAATGIYLGVYDGPADPLGVYVLGGPFGSEPLRVGRVSDFITPGASIVPTPGRVSAGWYHTLAVGADGGVLAWGSPTWIAAAGTAVAGSAARRISGVPAAAAVEAGASVLAVATVLGRDLSATQWEVLAPIPRGLPAAVGALRLTQCDGAPGTVFVLAASGSVLLGSGAPVAGLDGAADIREDSYAGSGRCLLTVVKRDGTLWRADLVVGAGRIVSSTVLQVTGLPAVAQASCSRDGNNGELCLALSTAGEVYTWGSSNRYGQMGDGTQGEAGRVLPGRVPGLAGIVRVLAGDGTLYRWGFQPFELPRPSPAAVGGLPGRVVDFSASFNHVVALLEDGSVWGWGDNSQGQLGDGSTGNTRLVPVRALGLSLK
ncbi:MAG: hypothetical protein JNN18_23265 [Rubrivivax sp.]|nr:hypothetical protein [Rubrivivax sp.]